MQHIICKQIRKVNCIYGRIVGYLRLSGYMFMYHRNAWNNGIVARGQMSNVSRSSSSLLLPSYSPWGRHRAFTTPCHLVRSCAVAFASFQDMEMVFNSVFMVIPRFLFPCGFQSRECRTMQLGCFRRVWPIHRHFRRLMTVAIGSCCVLLQRFEIVSG